MDSWTLIAVAVVWMAGVILHKWTRNHKKLK